MLLHVAHFTTAGVCLRDNRALASPSIDVGGSNVQAQRIFEFLTNPSIERSFRLGAHFEDERL
jgi:hypothetical protein